MSVERPTIHRESDRRLLGEMLIEAGLTSRSGLAAGLEEQHLRGGRLGFNLVKVGSVTPAAFHLFLQDHLEALSPDLIEALRVAPAVDLIPARLAHQYGMLPLRVRDGILDLAVATADAAMLVPAVQELTGLRVEPVICPPALIAKALHRFYPSEIETGVVQRPGENLLLLTDRRRDLRPLLPEMVRDDAPAGDWLRAILAEGIRRGARRIRIEPGGGMGRVAYDGALVEGAAIDLPNGAAPGLLSLLTGLAGILARGRVAPREGRLTLCVEARRIRVSILMMPGLEGDSCRLDLRSERVSQVTDSDLSADLPDLPPILQEWSRARRGVLFLVAPGPAERAAGLSVLLKLLGGRLPSRLACADADEIAGVATLGLSRDDEEALPLDALAGQAIERNPDLIILPESSHPGAVSTALALAAERPVLGSLSAVDAFEAAEQLACRAGRQVWNAAPLLGFLGVRLMERLCEACARPFDLHDLLSPWPGHRRPPTGKYLTSQGCDACRGSGQIRLEPVFEFVPGTWLVLTGRAPARAAALRDLAAREGRRTLFHSGLRRAAAGIVDVKEPLRLLLHELG